MFQECSYSASPKKIYTGLPERSDDSQTRFSVRLARGRREIESALRLRSRVFNEELGASGSERDVNRYDAVSRHLIVECTATGETVGAYRLNTIETVGSRDGFYSANEFALDDLPVEILNNGVEIGRACISKEYRNSKVLFLLWSGLLKYLEESGKRYFFGCCSIFTREESQGAAAYRKVAADGHLHREFVVRARRNAVDININADTEVELPSLFNLYLRLGAKVCGPPMIDHEFGTIDFFVLLDIRNISEKYRRMFSIA